MRTLHADMATQTSPPKPASADVRSWHAKHSNPAPALASPSGHSQRSRSKRRVLSAGSRCMRGRWQRHRKHIRLPPGLLRRHCACGSTWHGCSRAARITLAPARRASEAEATALPSISSYFDKRQKAAPVAAQHPLGGAAAAIQNSSCRELEPARRTLSVHGLFGLLGGDGRPDNEASEVSGRRRRGTPSAPASKGLVASAAEASASRALAECERKVKRKMERHRQKLVELSQVNINTCER